MNKFLKYSYLIAIWLAIGACNNNDSVTENNEHNEPNENKKRKQIEFKLVNNNESTVEIGAECQFSINVNDTLLVDSAYFYVNNAFVGKFSKDKSFVWNTEDAKTGTQRVKATVFSAGVSGSQFTTIELLSDLKPELSGYKIIKTYPHDPRAFTQGLIYEDGYFYEATGLKGASSLRKVSLEKGEIIQSFTIPRTIFGEGIATFDDKIVQLSWRANTGFVYEKESFKLLSKFSYPTEGWGLTYDGNKLIMSDGTHILYKLETSSFSEVERQEVYDNKGKVNELNELEFINGEIYANKYLTDTIVRIDPGTGKVLGYIDFTGLLADEYRTRETDVLNGIAYDSENDRLFVTGKNGPNYIMLKLNNNVEL